MLAYTYHGILLAIKRKELLIHVTSWINLYKVILSEESQYPKFMIPFIWHSWNDTIIQTEPLLPENEVKCQKGGKLEGNESG